MSKRFFIIILTLGLFLAVLNIRTYAYDDADFQVWNTDVEEFKVNKDLKIALEEEFRWGDNANEFYYHHYDVGVIYALNKYWNIGGGYRHVYELSKGKFKLENEPYLTTAVSLQKEGFAFDSRSRIEYRHFDYTADAWRYRNKFTLKLPWKFTQIKIQPYLADEIFLGSQNKTFSCNRFYSGLGVSLSKNLIAEIYYLLQSSRSSSNWIAANVLGTKLKILF